MADKNTAELLRQMRERNYNNPGTKPKPVKIEELKAIAENKPAPKPKPEKKTAPKKKERKPKPAGKGTGKKRGPYKPRKPKE